MVNHIISIVGWGTDFDSGDHGTPLGVQTVAHDAEDCQMVLAAQEPRITPNSPEKAIQYSFCT